MGNFFVDGGNQCIQFTSRVLYCKLPRISKQLPAFPYRVPGFEPPASAVGSKCVTTTLQYPPRMNEE